MMQWCTCPLIGGRCVNQPTACPDTRVVVDIEQHARWHDLVTEQTGITGSITDTTIREARGMRAAAPPDRTLIDTRKRTGRRT